MYTKSLSIVLGALLSTGIVVAQSQDQTQPQAQNAQAANAPSSMANTHAAPNPDRQAKHLRKKLGLTREQTAQIKPILAARVQEAQSIRSDSSLTPQDRRSKMQGIQQDSKNKIEAVLNDQQKQQFEQMLQERRAKRTQPPQGQ